MRDGAWGTTWKGDGNSGMETRKVSTQELELIGRISLAVAAAVGVSQIGLLWALVRRAGRHHAPAAAGPSPDMTLEMLENEVDQLRGELYRLRKERDWLRKECARLAGG